MSEAAKMGRDYCTAQPDLMVPAVWQEAMLHFPTREERMAFVNGYISERTRLDEHRAESGFKEKETSDE